MGCINTFCAAVFEYDTAKLVHIKNKKIGLLFRLFQLLIISYILGYVIIYKKGYQNTTDVLSAVTTKVKGIVDTNFTAEEFHPAIKNISIYNRVWDVADYVIPPAENNAFFIATNLIITHQTQGTCPEDPEVPGAICEDRSNCTAGVPLPTGNGIMTGRCVNSGFWSYENVTTCEITGWCDVEEDYGPLNDTNIALLADTKKSTVLVKNYVMFKDYKKGFRRRNIVDGANKTYLNGCHYNSETDPQCPVFILEDVVRGAGENYDVMAVKGGVMSIIISWNCDFDQSEDKCIPTYGFQRMDNPDVNIAKGWNFRYTHVFEDKSRTLYKAYGIDFVILVNGKGGWFHLVPLLLNIGSGLGLLAVATVIADVFVMYVVQKRELYKEKKFLMVGTEDDGFNDLLPSFRRKQASSPEHSATASASNVSYGTGNFNYGLHTDTDS